MNRNRWGLEKKNRHGIVPNVAELLVALIQIRLYASATAGNSCILLFRPASLFLGNSYGNGTPNEQISWGRPSQLMEQIELCSQLFHRLSKIIPESQVQQTCPGHSHHCKPWSWRQNSNPQGREGRGRREETWAPIASV